ncbi:MAG: LOG family protein [Candidatus Omnitrophota bacterium]
MSVCFLLLDVHTFSGYFSQQQAYAGSLQASANPRHGMKQAEPVEIIGSLALPAELGTIQESFVPAAYRAGTPFVFFLQNAHTVYDSEKNIRDLIGSVRERYGLDLVLLEGGEGKLDSLFFDSFPDIKIRQRVLEDYLQKGELTGGEVASSWGDSSGTRYFGIEEQALYRENKKAFLEASGSSARLLKILAERREDLLRRGEGVLSEPVSAFLEKKEAWAKGEIDLPAYLKELKNLKADFSEPDFPNIARIVKASDKEEDSPEILQELAAIEGSKLSEEVSALEAALCESLPRTPDEREMLRAFRKNEVLVKLAKLELPRKEWEELKETGDTQDIPLFQSQLRFYELAERRDAAMSENILGELKERKAKTAAVVTGGFHRSGITARLQAEGIPYVVMAPAIGHFEDKSKYFGLMQGRASYMKYFRSNLWDALAQDYVMKIEKALSEDPGKRAASGLLFKQWRDQIIRGSIAEERVSEAGRYTKYIDDWALKGDGKKQTRKEMIGKELDTFLNAYLEKIQSVLDRKIDAIGHHLRSFVPRSAVIAASYLSTELAMIPEMGSRGAWAPKEGRHVAMSSTRLELRTIRELGTFHRSETRDEAAEEIRALVESHYGLALESDPEVLGGGVGSVLLGGTEAREIFTADGRRLAWKFLSKMPLRARYIVELVQHWHEDQLPVPAMLSRTDAAAGSAQDPAEPYLTEYRGGYYGLEEFMAAGEATTRGLASDEHFESVGEIAARLQNSGLTFQPRNLYRGLAKLNIFDALAETHEEFTEEAGGLFDRLAAVYGGDHAVLSKLRELRPTLAELFDRHLGYLDTNFEFGKQTMAHLHNDLQFGNLRFGRRMRISALFDFNLAEYNLRVAEFGNLVFSNPENPWPAAFVPGHFLAAHKGYLKRLKVPLSPTEFSGIWEMLRLRLLEFAIFPFKRALDLQSRPDNLITSEPLRAGWKQVVKTLAKFSEKPYVYEGYRLLRSESRAMPVLTPQELTRLEAVYHELEGNLEAFLNDYERLRREYPGIRFLFLVRHGESTSNLMRLAQSYEDMSPLTLRGLGQRDDMTAYFLRKRFLPDSVYASPLERAYETVRPLAESAGLEVIPMKRFREVLSTPMGGIPWDLANKVWPDAWDRFLDDPDALEIPSLKPGEKPIYSGRNFKEYWTKFADEFIGSAETKRMVGTHGATALLVLADLLGIPSKKFRAVYETLKSPRNLGISVVAYIPQKQEWKLMVNGDDSYLKAHLRGPTQSSWEAAFNKIRFYDLALERLLLRLVGVRETVLEDYYPILRTFVRPSEKQVLKIAERYEDARRAQEDSGEGRRVEMRDAKGSDFDATVDSFRGDQKPGIEEAFFKVKSMGPSISKLSGGENPDLLGRFKTDYEQVGALAIVPFLCEFYSEKEVYELFLEAIPKNESLSYGVRHQVYEDDRDYRDGVRHNKVPLTALWPGEEGDFEFLRLKPTFREEAQEKPAQWQVAVKNPYKADSPAREALRSEIQRTTEERWKEFTRYRSDVKYSQEVADNRAAAAFDRIANKGGDLEVRQHHTHYIVRHKGKDFKALVNSSLTEHHISLTGDAEDYQDPVVETIWSRPLVELGDPVADARPLIDYIETLRHFRRQRTLYLWSQPLLNGHPDHRKIHEADRQKPFPGFPRPPSLDAVQDVLVRVRDEAMPLAKKWLLAQGERYQAPVRKAMAEKQVLLKKELFRDHIRIQRFYKRIGMNTQLTESPDLDGDVAQVIWAVFGDGYIERESEKGRDQQEQIEKYPIMVDQDGHFGIGKGVRARDTGRANFYYREALAGQLAAGGRGNYLGVFQPYDFEAPDLHEYYKAWEDTGHIGGNPYILWKEYPNFPYISPLSLHTEDAFNRSPGSNSPGLELDMAVARSWLLVLDTATRNVDNKFTNLIWLEVETPEGRKKVLGKIDPDFHLSESHRKRLAFERIYLAQAWRYWALDPEAFRLESYNLDAFAEAVQSIQKKVRANLEKMLQEAYVPIDRSYVTESIGDQLLTRDEIGSFIRDVANDLKEDALYMLRLMVGNPYLKWDGDRIIDPSSAAGPGVPPSRQARAEARTLGFREIDRILKNPGASMRLIHLAAAWSREQKIPPATSETIRYLWSLLGVRAEDLPPLNMLADSVRVLVKSKPDQEWLSGQFQNSEAAVRLDLEKIKPVLRQIVSEDLEQRQAGLEELIGLAEKKAGVEFDAGLWLEIRRVLLEQEKYQGAISLHRSMELRFVAKSKPDQVEVRGMVVLPIAFLLWLVFGKPKAHWVYRHAEDELVALAAEAQGIEDPESLLRSSSSYSRSRLQKMLDQIPEFTYFHYEDTQPKLPSKQPQGHEMVNLAYARQAEDQGVPFLALHQRAQQLSITDAARWEKMAGLRTMDLTRLEAFNSKRLYSEQTTRLLVKVAWLWRKLFERELGAYMASVMRVFQLPEEQSNFVHDAARFLYPLTQWPEPSEEEIIRGAIGLQRNDEEIEEERLEFIANLWKVSGWLRAADPEEARPAQIDQMDPEAVADTFEEFALRLGNDPDVPAVFEDLALSAVFLHALQQINASSRPEIRTKGDYLEPVVREFGITHVSKTVWMQGGGSIESEPIPRLTTSGGDLAVKHWRKVSDRGHASLIADFARDLTEGGIPMTLIPKAASRGSTGDDFFMEYLPADSGQKQYYVVEKWVDGEEVLRKDATPQQLRAAGRMLGRIHRRSHDYMAAHPGLSEQSVGSYSFEVGLGYVLDQTGEWMPRLEPYLHAGDRDILRRVIDSSRAYWTPERLRGFSRQLIMSDYNFANMKFDSAKNDVTAIFDLDNVRIGYAFEDFIPPLTYVGKPGGGFYVGNPGRDLKALLGGYQEGLGRRLDSGELESIRMFLSTVALWMSVFLLRKCTGGEGDERWIRRSLQSLEQMKTLWEHLGIIRLETRTGETGLPERAAEAWSRESFMQAVRETEKYAGEIIGAERRSRLPKVSTKLTAIAVDLKVWTDQNSGLEEGNAFPAGTIQRHFVALRSISKMHRDASGGVVDELRFQDAGQAKIAFAKPTLSRGSSLQTDERLALLDLSDRLYRLIQGARALGISDLPQRKGPKQKEAKKVSAPGQRLLGGFDAEPRSESRVGDSLVEDLEKQLKTEEDYFAMLYAPGTFLEGHGKEVFGRFENMSDGKTRAFENDVWEKDHRGTILLLAAEPVFEIRWGDSAEQKLFERATGSTEAFPFDVLKALVFRATVEPLEVSFSEKNGFEFLPQERYGRTIREYAKRWADLYRNLASMQPDSSLNLLAWKILALGPRWKTVRVPASQVLKLREKFDYGNLGEKDFDPLELDRTVQLEISKTILADVKAAAGGVSVPQAMIELNMDIALSSGEDHAALFETVLGENGKLQFYSVPLRFNKIDPSGKLVSYVRKHGDNAQTIYELGVSRMNAQEVEIDASVRPMFKGYIQEGLAHEKKGGIFFGLPLEPPRRQAFFERIRRMYGSEAQDQKMLETAVIARFVSTLRLLASEHGLHQEKHLSLDATIVKWLGEHYGIHLSGPKHLTVRRFLDETRSIRDSRAIQRPRAEQRAEPSRTKLIQEVIAERERIAQRPLSGRPPIVIMGAGKVPRGHPYYKLGVKLGRELFRFRIPPRTGAGPGMMEAPLLGYKQAKRRQIISNTIASLSSIGIGLWIFWKIPAFFGSLGASHILIFILCFLIPLAHLLIRYHPTEGMQIKLPWQQLPNPYVDHVELYERFTTRKMALYEGVMGSIFLPGGFGTLDELFELWRRGVPVVLLGKEFWQPVMDQFYKRLEESNLSDHLDYRQPAPFVTDNPREAIQYVIREHKAGRSLAPTTPEQLLGINQELTDSLALLERKSRKYGYRAAAVFTGKPPDKSRHLRLVSRLAEFFLSINMNIRTASYHGLYDTLRTQFGRPEGWADRLQAFLYFDPSQEQPRASTLAKGAKSFKAGHLVVHDPSNHQLLMAYDSHVAVFLPGGVGTLNKFHDYLNLMKTKKIRKRPILLVGRNFWEPYMKGLEEQMGPMITAEDKQLYRIVSPENLTETFRYLEEEIFFQRFEDAVEQASLDERKIDGRALYQSLRTHKTGIDWTDPARIDRAKGILRKYKLGGEGGPSSAPRTEMRSDVNFLLARARKIDERFGAQMSFSMEDILRNMIVRGLTNPEHVLKLIEDDGHGFKHMLAAAEMALELAQTEISQGRPVSMDIAGLGGFFHDVYAPIDRKVHEQMGAETARAVLKKLEIPSLGPEAVDAVAFAVEHHNDDPLQLASLPNQTAAIVRDADTLLESLDLDRIARVSQQYNRAFFNPALSLKWRLRVLGTEDRETVEAPPNDALLFLLRNVTKGLHPGHYATQAAKDYVSREDLLDVNRSKIRALAEADGTAYPPDVERVMDEVIREYRKTRNETRTATRASEASFFFKKTLMIGGKEYLLGSELLNNRSATADQGEVESFVFLAVSLDGKDRVAVRVVPFNHPNGTDNMTFIAAFQNERGILNYLEAQHYPHMARVLGLGFDQKDDYVWLATEWIEGVTLSRWLKGHRSFSEIADLFGKLLEAVQELHRLGIYHLDLKPNNILIDRAGDVKLIDFALSVSRGKDGPFSNPVLEGLWHGNPFYIAPAIYFFQEAYPQRDIFALGVILFELLTKKAYLGDVWSDVIRLFGRSLVQLDELVRILQPRDALAPLLFRAFSSDSDGNYPSVEAFKSSFEYAKSLIESQTQGKDGGRTEMRSTQDHRPFQMQRAGMIRRVRTRMDEWMTRHRQSVLANRDAMVEELAAMDAQAGTEVGTVAGILQKYGLSLKSVPDDELENFADGIAGAGKDAEAIETIAWSEDEILTARQLADAIQSMKKATLIRHEIPQAVMGGENGREQVRLLLQMVRESFRLNEKIKIQIVADDLRGEGDLRAVLMQMKKEWEGEAIMERIQITNREDLDHALNATAAPDVWVRAGEGPAKNSETITLDSMNYADGNKIIYSGSENLGAHAEIYVAALAAAALKQKTLEWLAIRDRNAQIRSEAVRRGLFGLLANVLGEQASRAAITRAA